MGKIIGALVADVNLRGIWDIVDNIRIGETGRVFLVSNDGTLIAHSDKKRVLKNENLKGEKEVQSVLAGKTEARELGSKSLGKFISSYAPIPGIGWGVVLRQSQDEAYLFSKVMQVQSWVIIILSELAAILASIFMGKVLARPVGDLAARIRKVAEGDLDHKIGIKMRDEIGELIRSFNEMVKKLKKARERERLSAIGEAVTWITHELKNSFIPIKAFVQMFPHRQKDQKFMEKFSRLVPEEINRLERMFKELSDFSSHFELRRTTSDIKEIMDNTLEIMKEEFVEKKINIKYYAESDNFYAEADPQRLRQVFMNLIINSINAMPAGGSLFISLRSLAGVNPGAPAYVEVRIKDMGEGMPKEMLENIFEPFRTTKVGGMGLGLTISRKIVEGHGGQIAVESEESKGTAFIVRLPVHNATGGLYVHKDSFGRRP
jgi:signal transduction histidine kinase